MNMTDKEIDEAQRVMTDIMQGEHHSVESALKINEALRQAKRYNAASALIDGLEEIENIWEWHEENYLKAEAGNYIIRHIKAEFKKLEEK